MGASIDVIMPAELEGTKAVVRSWLKAVGEAVRRDEPLVELETDKVTTEVPAPADGVLLEILLDSNAEAGPGALLGRLGERAAMSVALDAPRPLQPTSASPGPRESREDRLSPAVRRGVTSFWSSR